MGVAKKKEKKDQCPSAHVCSRFELQRKAYRFILDRFQEVVSSVEFQNVTVREPTDIQKRDDINVRKESTVWEAILHYTAHRLEEGKGHLLVLFSLVSSVTSFSLDLAESRKNQYCKITWVLSNLLLH